jgi:uncharacterized protein with FMN-binding domain
METQNSNNKKLILTIASIFALGTAGVIAYNYYAEPKFNVEVKQTTQKEMTKPETKVATTTETSTYKNGTYTKTGKYVSPGGPEEIEIMVTIEDGVIKEASATPKAVLAGSIKFQTAFSGGFKELIVGKNIDEIMLDKVAGSSLTPKGFNNAIEQIKMDAKL